MYLYIGSNINMINTKAHVRYTQVDMADYILNLCTTTRAIEQT